MKKKKKKAKIKKKTNRLKRKKTRLSPSKKRIKKSKKRRKKKIKKPKTKKIKKKSLYKRLDQLDFEGFIGSIKPKITFNFQDFFKKLIFPVINEIRNFKKQRERLRVKQEKQAKKEQKLQSSLRTELLKKEIKQEQILAKARAIELKNFLREEQKLIREKEREKQNKFLEEVKLEKTLEKFRAREISEIKAIEKYSLNIEKEDFKAFQQRIDQVKEKYKALRNERLRKRVEELGVTLSDQATVEEIRKKEKEYLERREVIETSLDSFVRSAISLIYQINKRYLPRNADLLRVINLVYEQSEIIIREDQEQNENFLILIYIKDQDIKKDLIIVEDKIKQETREYNRGQIFKFGDDLTDSMIRYLELIRERTKKAS
tara:strand:+ start:2416 stop:3537 length:1122 start_codon:yes stop_codon:yes gene_type:complete